MADATHSHEVLHRGDGAQKTLHLVRDEDGRPCALVEAHAHPAGDYFHDPECGDSGWYSYSVQWSRSGTVVSGSLRSTDLDATIAAVAEWESRAASAAGSIVTGLTGGGAESTPLAGLVADHRIARERAGLASRELVRSRGTARWNDACLRAQAFFAELATLEESLATELERSGIAHGLPVGRPAGGNTTFSRAAAEAEEHLCRVSVLAAAVDELNRSGVVVGVPPGLLSRVASTLGVPVARVRALWPSSEIMEADVLLHLAKDGLGTKADDENLIDAWNLVARQSERLRDPAERRAVLDELIQLLTVESFSELTGSMEWRNYVACTTSASSSPQLAESLRSEMSAAEEAFATRMGEFYRNILPLVGFRLRSSLRDDHRAFGVLLVAALEGLGVVRHSLHTVWGAAYGSPSCPTPIASLAVDALIDALLEPDPEFDCEAAILRLTEGLVLDLQSH
ncbi:hypothetical protein ACEXQD_18470 [Herbiconiux sp. P15]|uniref:hypothetical protein n=1 Tax=Herbiconiux liukaitaii TaxID=3342799 RepID=UPI0035B96E7C